MLSSEQFCIFQFNFIKYFEKNAEKIGVRIYVTYSNLDKGWHLEFIGNIQKYHSSLILST